MADSAHTLCGWLLLDKSPGMTSRQAIAPLGKLFSRRGPIIEPLSDANGDSSNGASNNNGGKRRRGPRIKFGHAGTLDPFARGLLPVAIGQATKCMQFVSDSKKCYRLKISWGSKTTTDDPDGETMARSDKRPTQDMVKAAIQNYLGTIEQMPPDFSAIKINGQRAYAIARGGEKPQLSARPVVIHSIEMTGAAQAGEVDSSELEVVCGKGTYMRALARDLGEDLGCLGHLSYLRRTQVNNFFVENALTNESLQSIVNMQIEDGIQSLRNKLLPLEAGLDNIQSLEVSDSQMRSLRNGCSLRVEEDLAESQRLQMLDTTSDGDWIKALFKGRLVAIAVSQPPFICPYRIFNV